MRFKDRRIGLLKKSKNYFWGIFWILLSIFISVSVFSYSETDESFNNISTNPNVSNFFGRPGSYLSDLALQLFGYSSIVCAFVFFVLGYKIIKNKIIYNKLQKFFAFIGLVISSSIIIGVLLSGNSCPTRYCGGILGEFFINNLYSMPSYLLILTSLMVLFVSISFFCDIRKRWWLVKTTRTYRTIKKIVLWMVSGVVFIFELLTTKNFRLKIKRYFVRLFNRKSGEFVLIDDEEEKQESIERIEEKPKEKKMFGIFAKKEKDAEKSAADKINVVDLKDIIKPKDDIKINRKRDKYILPNTGLLNKVANKNKLNITKEELERQSLDLVKVLKDFGIKGDMLTARAGPIITLHEFEPSAGTKSSRVIGLADDIARSMSAVSARISVIPGRNAMGIELPNKQRETIYIKDLIDSSEYRNSKASLPIIIGSDIAGDAIVADLAKMPHLLVAGTTGSGKSVAINTMITSLLYKMTPDQCKFIMIDPKMLELSVYEGIPHLLTPVVTEPLKAITALKWVCREMEDRYRIMASLGVRNIAGYNEKLNNAIKNGTKLTRRVQTGFDSETDEPIYEEREIEEREMPYIVVIVDEMADLMITAGKEIEASIQRIAQKARAAGIHIIMATQRPSVDVITGVIKANFPTRMSFQVVSKIDSRTILGEQGAEQLLGMGDMLFMAGGGKIIRAHGPFVSDDEVEKIVNFIKSQGFEPNYVDEVLKNDDEFSSGDAGIGAGGDGDLFGYDGEKDLYKQALAIVKRDRKCSVSYIQRQLRIGYNKAANLVEEMERNGILSSPGNTGKREILIDENE